MPGGTTEAHDMGMVLYPCLLGFCMWDLATPWCIGEASACLLLTQALSLHNNDSDQKSEPSNKHIAKVVTVKWVTRDSLFLCKS